MLVAGECNAGVRHELISTVKSKYGFHEVLQVIHLQKNQLDAQLIFSIFRQTLLHVSCISTAHHQGVQPYGYNIWYLMFFLDDCLLSWLGSSPICCGEAICKNGTNYVQEENMEMEMRGDGLVGRSVGWLSFDLSL